MKIILVVSYTCYILTNAKNASMNNDLVAVFTGKNLENGMMEDGGSGHWIARKNRVREARYLLCIRNRRETWAETDVLHGTAFLVARISGTSPSKHDNRIVINFTEYAEINVPKAWSICTGGQRYPVAYLDSDIVQKDLGLDFDALIWKPFKPKAKISLQVVKNSPINIQEETLQQNMDDTKDALDIEDNPNESDGPLLDVVDLVNGYTSATAKAADIDLIIGSLDDPKMIKRLATLIRATH